MVRAAVIVFPGSNCDRDIAVALRASMGTAPAMVWHGGSELPDADLIVLPGGFSYGDYLRSGAMAAHSPIMRSVVAAAARGVRVLAVCNGFQIAAESRLVPGVLMPNATLRFVCKDVYLRVDQADSVFTGGFARRQVLRMPIAHRDGNFFVDDETLARLEDNGQIAFRYCTAAGEPAWEANPNGSRGNIAGVLNEKRTVLGMMPHPERVADARLGGTDGKRMLDAMIGALS